MSAYERVQDGAPPEHGIQDDDAWQDAIACYLAKRCDMGPIGIFEVLRACEHDEVTRARYLRLAREPTKTPKQLRHG